MSENVLYDMFKNEDSNQPAHSCNLIRVFVVPKKKLCVLGYLKCTEFKVMIKQRERANWSDTSLGAHIRSYEGIFSDVAASMLWVLIRSASPRRF